MLENTMDTCIGCMIALVNGMNEVEEWPSEFEDIKNALYALKLHQDVEHWIDILREDKRKVVPDCFICMNPCGRTSEVSLNEKGEAFANRGQYLILNFEKMTDLEIFHYLGGLPYDF